MVRHNAHNLKRVSVFAVIAAALSVALATESVLASGYSTAVLADSPVGYWQFDGSLTDSAGTFSTGTYMSSSLSCSGGAVSGTTSALCADGSNIVALTGSGGATVSGLGPPITFEFWTLATSTTGGGEVFAAYTSGSGPRFEIWAGGGGTASGYGGTGPDGPSCTYPHDNAWHMLDFVYESSKITQYVDGTLAASGCGASGNPRSGSAPSASTGNYCMWAVGDGNHYNTDPGGCTGGTVRRQMGSGNHVAQLSITRSALSASRIAARYGTATTTPAEVWIARQCGFAVLLQGQTCQVALHSKGNAASGYADTTSGDSFTLISTVPATGLTCSAGGGTLWNCLGTDVGSYVVTWQDAHALQASTTFVVALQANVFQIRPVNVNIPTGQKVRFDSFATDVNGVNVSIADSYTVTSQPHQTCGTVALDASLDFTVSCTYDLAGTYTVTFTDFAGRIATATVNVSTAVSTTVCTTDIAGVQCVLSQVWNSITDGFNNLLAMITTLPSALSTFFFVSPSGKSYIDTSSLTAAALIPSVTCRSGQSPTAADGINCLPFPFSLPYDAASFLSLMNVSPVAPSFTLSWDFHYLGSTIHAGPAVTLDAILTPAIMTYIRGGELVLFILGTALGTWRILQLVGVS